MVNTQPPRAGRLSVNKQNRRLRPSSVAEVGGTTPEPGHEAQVKRSGMPPTGAECPYLQQRGLNAAHLTSRNREIMRFASEGTRPFTAFAADMDTYTVITP